MFKKLIITISLLFCFVTISYAQSPIEIGQYQFNVGTGLSNAGIPLYVGLDYGIIENITIGGILSYQSLNDSASNTRYRLNATFIGFNGNYHFNNLLNIADHWDLYAGIVIGYNFWSNAKGHEGPHNSGVGGKLQIGGRHYFSDTFGVNLEFGGGADFTSTTFGASFRF